MLGSPGRLLEALHFVEAIAPVDLSSGANNGAWVSLAHYKRIVVLFVAAPGTASDTVTLTLNQAKDLSGTGSKALNFTTYYTNEQTTNLASVDTLTKNTQASANTISDTNAAKDQMWLVELHAEELDDANGFKTVQATVNQITHSKVGYVAYL